MAHASMVNAKHDASAALRDAAAWAIAFLRLP